ncbi:MAG: hypothetical protein HFI69_12220 [Lachnospiraceae bacterium]|nr:hypothetical protein [Lachnospiraceae bacterium]
MAKQNKKIVKFHRMSQLNIGVIIFLIIFIYLVYNIFQYFTTEQIAVYEVSQGTITQNNIYTGTILREEKIYTAEKSGYINYYNKDASKVGVSTYVYSIDETGTFYKDIRAKNNGQLFSDKDSYKDLEKTASNYVNDYSDKTFYQVYSFKYDMEAELMEAINEMALSSLEDSGSNYSNLHIYRAAEPGVVVYNTDGLENVTIDNFTADIFDQSAHGKNNLMVREQVTAGDPAYKLITSEIWNLVIPINQQLAEELSEESNLKIKFKKDNSTAWGASRIIQRDGANYLILNFQNSGLRYATDRYLEIELLRSDISGLKLPNTALTKKEFFLIPKKYLTKGGNDNSNGVMRRYENEDGKTITEFASVVVAEETEEMYYIDGSELSAGDTILKMNSSETFILREQKALQGVYNINRGYAVFRKIEVLYQNEEYTIVDTGTNFGISLYDHIALDASAISENQLIQ